MKIDCSLLVLLLSASSGVAKARTRNARRAEPLTQYTPTIKDWESLNQKPIPSNPDHNLDSVHWIDETQWLPWDGTPYNASQYSRSDLADVICPGNTIRGLRAVFNEANPFSDPVHPTKAEVDNWHAIAINHVRALVGYTEEEYKIEPDQCLHVRALWSEERAVTDIWDESYPDGTCLGSTNPDPHCGASFIPALEDQAPYLPDGVESCGGRAGSEGIFNAAKSNIPWSIRFIRPLCSTLGAEGFWGGHTGPWFHRKQFGFSWYDWDPEDSNTNARLVAKWAGDRAPNKYVDPRITDGDFLLQVEGEDPNPRFNSFQCDGTIWLSGGSPSATHCYHRVMADEALNKRFFTWKGDGGCAGYPAAMEKCEVVGSATRLTWDLSPRSFSFDGLMIDPDDLLWNNRECKNIKWQPEAKAGDASQCLENLMAAQYEECGRNFMTWNAANGGCACYAPDQPCENRGDTLGRSGRKTYRLLPDPAYEPPSPNPPTLPPVDPPTLPPVDPPTPPPVDPPTPPPVDPPTPPPVNPPTLPPVDPPTLPPVDPPTLPPVDPPTPPPVDPPTPPPVDPPTLPPVDPPTPPPVDPPTPPPVDPPTLPPVNPPTLPPVNPPTPPPVGCAQCTDEASQWMIDNDKPCATAYGAIQKHCNASPFWTANGYCRQTCFEAGRGYDGDDCCVAPPPDDCVACTDEASQWMIDNGKPCATTYGAIQKHCNASPFWTANGYCRQTCFEAGRGYDGDDCCVAPQPDCIACTDEASPWMIDNGKECATATNIIEENCNTSPWWFTHKWCQQSCFEAGRGYNDPPCCDSSI